VEAKTQTLPPYGVPPPTFRLPDAAHVGAVHLQVSNLQQSVDYYQRVVGLRAQEITESSAALSAHEDERRLVVLRSRPGVGRARRGAFGLYHFAILLPDRAALGRFAAHLESLDERVAMADHLVSEALYLWDPDGLGIEVYADRPRESWQQQGGELAMTTDPLNIQSVIASGRGEQWGGAPAGTTMGHVHLHVGSLEQAEAFYHRALGLDKTVWSYPGALFMSAGGYHHHLATNTWSPGPSPSADQAQLSEWELILPSDSDVAEVTRSLRDAAYSTEQAGNEVTALDPWGTRVRIRPGR
jgi:catechol 2,3-dioxygenase